MGGDAEEKAAQIRYGARIVALEGQRVSPALRGTEFSSPREDRKPTLGSPA